MFYNLTHSSKDTLAFLNRDTRAVLFKTPTADSRFQEWHGSTEHNVIAKARVKVLLYVGVYRREWNINVLYNANRLHTVARNAAAFPNWFLFLLLFAGIKHRR